MRSRSTSEAIGAGVSRGRAIATAALAASLFFAWTAGANAGQASGVAEYGSSGAGGATSALALRERVDGALTARAKKKRPPKRSWRMSIETAEEKADAYAERIYDQTEPQDFDSSDEDLPDRAWEDYYEDGCERLSRSKFACIWRVTSDWIDVYDDELTDEYLFSDYYACEGELEVWYPRARKKVLKQESTDPECFWETVDAGSDWEDGEDPEDGFWDDEDL